MAKPTATAELEIALATVGTATLRGLGAFEQIQRRLHPPAIEELRETLRPYASGLERALSEFRDCAPQAPYRHLHEQLTKAASLASRSFARFCERTSTDRWIIAILDSMRTFSRALEALYPLHRLPPVGRFFLEPAFHGLTGGLDPEPPNGVSVGLHASGDGSAPGERGGFCLYVPETYDGDEPWPLVVALHGGSGSGRDFIWAWLREARGRRFLLLAPTARGPTWSMIGPDVDAAAIRSMIEFVSRRWRVDRGRVLLTGLSDGATYGLMLALGGGVSCTGVAPIAGVLHPAALTGSGSGAAAGRRIYMVHGALDWMFPVSHARLGYERLAAAGAEIVFREIDDLSHTYPREENDAILAWFDSALALPAKATLS